MSDIDNEDVDYLDDDPLGSPPTIAQKTLNVIWDDDKIQKVSYNRCWDFSPIAILLSLPISISQHYCSMLTMKEIGSGNAFGATGPFNTGMLRRHCFMSAKRMVVRFASVQVMQSIQRTNKSTNDSY